VELKKAYDEHKGEKRQTLLQTCGECEAVREHAESKGNAAAFELQQEGESVTRKVAARAARYEEEIAQANERRRGARHTSYGPPTATSHRPPALLRHSSSASLKRGESWRGADVAPAACWCRGPGDAPLATPVRAPPLQHSRVAKIAKQKKRRGPPSDPGAILRQLKLSKKLSSNVMVSFSGDEGEEEQP